MVADNLPVHIGTVMDDRLKEIFNQCFCLLDLPWKQEEYYYLCQMIATMLTMISCAAKRSSTVDLTTKKTGGIGKAIAYIQNHLHEVITLGELAEVTHVSIPYLNYLFKHSTGYAPIEFFLKTKIQAAAKDLYFSDLPIKDIAITYGIEDPYYFSRLFKKIMGISPLEFRNRNKDR
jgi:AraC-like DNA-binding protein